jgi:hypothetical protein
MSVNPALVPTILLAIVLFFVGTKVQKRYPVLAAAIGVMLAVPATLALLYYTHLFDHWRWFYQARSLSFSELSFAGIGFLGGTIFSWQEPETWRERSVLPLFTAVFLFVPFMKSLLDPLDLNRLQDRCNGSVCLQSTFSTCGPASAATILRSYGQNVTERELAIESLTYRGGTEAWYLARALRRRENQAEFIFSSANSFPYPAIAGVRLRGGEGHFIAVLNVTDSAVTVVDPLSGEATIPLSALRKRYEFTGFFLKVTPHRPA